MARLIYNLNFHRDTFDKPILHGLGKRFRLTVNIRRAILNEEGGWAEVEFDGPEEEIGRAIADLQTTSVISSGPIEDSLQPDPEFYPTPVGRGT